LPRQNPSEKHCRLASEGDALSILGQISDGFEKHEQTAAITPDPLSMEEQAVHIAYLCGLSRAQGKRLAAIYEGGTT